MPGRFWVIVRLPPDVNLELTRRLVDGLESLLRAQGHVVVIPGWSGHEVAVVLEGGTSWPTEQARQAALSLIYRTLRHQDVAPRRVTIRPAELDSRPTPPDFDTLCAFLLPIDESEEEQARQTALAEHRVTTKIHLGLAKWDVSTTRQGLLLVIAPHPDLLGQAPTEVGVLHLISATAARSSDKVVSSFPSICSSMEPTIQAGGDVFISQDGSAFECHSVGVVESTSDESCTVTFHQQDRWSFLTAEDIVMAPVIMLVWSKNNGLELVRGVLGTLCPPRSLIVMAASSNFEAAAVMSFQVGRRADRAQQEQRPLGW